MNSRAAMQCELAAEVARGFGQINLQVTGRSMLPSLRPGDRVLVEGRHAKAILPGRIVLYVRNDDLVVHRLISRGIGGIVTRGDFVSHVDPVVQPDQIVGEVVAIERRGRRVAPDFTLGRRVGSWILRRWDFSVRVLLYFRSVAWAR